MSFRTLIASLPDAPFNPNGGADRFLNDVVAARDYCLSRREESFQLMREGVWTLPYVKVEISSQPYDRSISVDGKRGVDLTCVIAYILAKFW